MSSTSALLAGQAAQRTWAKKRGEPTLLDTAGGLIRTYAVPVALVAFAVRRFLQHRKKQPKKAAAAAAAPAATAAAGARKPRRTYKVQPQEGPVLVSAAGPEEDEGSDPGVQPHDNVMEGFNEDEVEAAGAAGAAGGPGGNQAMLQMLKQMGYRVVVPKDGSGQVYLVPPGAAVPGEEGGIPEGARGLGPGGGEVATQRGQLVTASAEGGP